MENVKFKNSRNKILAGIIYSAQIDSELIPIKTEKVIIMCHGYSSDKSMEGRTASLAKKLTASGFDCFAFDFSGCGESEDDSLSLTKEIEDLTSAVNFVKSLNYKKIAFYGHSLGALICLMAYSPKIVTMVLSGPLTDTIIQEVKKHYPEEQINELMEKGKISLPIKNSLRNSLVIDKQMLSDMEELEQHRVLSNIKCPILLIHGNSGPDETLLLTKTKKGLEFLPKESKLEIINGAEHNFGNYIETLNKLTDDWFKRYFQ